MNKIPEHLGGHLNRTNTDEPLLKHIKDRFNIRSMLDIGCGPGGMKEVANNMGIDWYGIDGDSSVLTNTDHSLVHDFTLGEAPMVKSFDLIWCTEFLEHVEEKYIPNYMPLFKLGHLAVVTAAPPGWPGHHHVNCREESYWVDVFKNYDLFFDEKLSFEFKTLSQMRKNFFKRAGMVFVSDTFKQQTHPGHNQMML